MSRPPFLQQPHTVMSTNKACERCNKRKQKCDGRLPCCGNCAKLDPSKCHYPPRRQRPKKPDRNGASIRRAQLSPSMSTGLIRMDESGMITSYMQCMGALRVISESEVRHAMILLSSKSPNGGAGGRGGASLRLDQTTIRERCELCVFYCVVALGGLLEGRPIKKVTYLLQLANNMVEPCLNEHDRCVDSFLRANIALACVHGYEGQGVPFEGPTKVYVDRAQRICAKGVSFNDGKRAFDDSDEDVPMECGDASNIAFLPDVQDLSRHAGMMPRKGSRLTTEESIANFVVSHGHSIRKAVATDLVGGDNLRRYWEESLGLYNELEASLDRPSCESRKGIVGLMANGQLAMLKAWQGDVEGVRDRAYRCVDIINTFKGSCRSQSGLYMAQMLALVLHTLDAREQYEKVREVFRNMWEEEKEIPPFEEWKGVDDFCSEYFCKELGHLYPEGWNVVPPKQQYAGPQLPSMYHLSAEPLQRASVFVAPPMSDGRGSGIPCGGLGLDSPDRPRGGRFFASGSDLFSMEVNEETGVVRDPPHSGLLGLPGDAMGMGRNMAQGTSLKGDGLDLPDSFTAMGGGMVRGRTSEGRRLESPMRARGVIMQDVISGKQGFGGGVDMMSIVDGTMQEISGVHSFDIPLDEMGTGGDMMQGVSLGGQGFGSTFDQMGMKGGAMTEVMPGAMMGAHVSDISVDPVRMRDGVAQRVSLELLGEQRFGLPVDLRGMGGGVPQGLTFGEQRVGRQVGSMGVEKRDLVEILLQESSDEEGSASPASHGMR